jgi:hypothetical protein
MRSRDPRCIALSVADRAAISPARRPRDPAFARGTLGPLTAGRCVRRGSMRPGRVARMAHVFRGTAQLLSRTLHFESGGTTR